MCVCMHVYTNVSARAKAVFHISVFMLKVNLSISGLPSYDSKCKLREEILNLLIIAFLFTCTFINMGVISVLPFL